MTQLEHLRTPAAALQAACLRAAGHRSRGGAALLCVVLGLGAASAMAAPTGLELRAAVTAAPTTIDPHRQNTTPNNALAAQIFEALVGRDSLQLPYPLLATSWELSADDLHWRFRLRRGVTFQNGQPFTATDVIFNFCRMALREAAQSMQMATPGSDGHVAGQLYPLPGAGPMVLTAPDPYTIDITTRGPEPLLLQALSNLPIISARSAGAPDDMKFSLDGCHWDGWDKLFTAGLASPEASGTGPYRIAAFSSADETVLEANPNYWGPAPQWQRATYTQMADDALRLRALFSGSADIIDQVPASALTTFNRKATFDVVQGRTNRVIYLAFDVASATAKGVEGTGGLNPFRDQRVRHAFSLAIDRQALGERVLSGGGDPTVELVPTGAPGLLGLEVPRADILYARALLADAGYPAGFSATLATPRDRYLQDKEVANAVALMLGRIGIRVTVDARPGTEFFEQRSKGEYSFYLAGLGSSMADLSAPLRLLATTPGDGTYGRLNFSGYSNPVVDALVRQSLATISPAKRLPALEGAARIVAEERPVLPLYFEKSSYGLRSELDYKPRTDQYLLADDVRYRGSAKLAN